MGSSGSRIWTSRVWEAGSCEFPRVAPKESMSVLGVTLLCVDADHTHCECGSLVPSFGMYLSKSSGHNGVCPVQDPSFCPKYMKVLNHILRDRSEPERIRVQHFSYCSSPTMMMAMVPME